MNIGEASKASGVSAKMIRYYEQIGLIPMADRTPSGYRAYSQADIQRLHFIRHARDLGFQVPEIGNLLGLWSDRSRRSADVKRLAAAHVAALGERMRNLQQMIDTLQSLVNCCAGDDRPDCPILAGLEQGAASPAAGVRRGAALHREIGRPAAAPGKRGR
ncbi:MAG: Cu(I)-responsive transcriptional regulator [Steroidobacteraceae bacterium]